MTTSEIPFWITCCVENQLDMWFLSIQCHSKKKKKKCCFGRIFILGCTLCCKNDNFQCSQWQENITMSFPFQCQMKCLSLLRTVHCLTHGSLKKNGQHFLNGIVMHFPEIKFALEGPVYKRLFGWWVVIIKQATSHYLKQWWPNPMALDGITRVQWA